MTAEDDGGVWYLARTIYTESRDQGNSRLISFGDALAGAMLYFMVWAMTLRRPSTLFDRLNGECEVDECPRDAVDGYTRCVRHGAGKPGTHNRL